MASPPIKTTGRKPDYVHLDIFQRITNVNWGGGAILWLQRGNPTFTATVVVTQIEFSNTEDGDVIVTLNSGADVLPPLAHAYVDHPTPIPAIANDPDTLHTAAKSYKWWRPGNNVDLDGLGKYHSLWGFGINLKKYPPGTTFHLTQDVDDPAHPEFNTFNFQLWKNKDTTPVIDFNDAIHGTYDLHWDGTTITF